MCMLITRLVNDVLQCGYLFILNWNSPQGTLALNGNQYSLFACAFAAFDNNAQLRLWCAANILSIQFHNALKHPGVGTFGVHHLPDGVAHTPGRRLCDTN